LTAGAIARMSRAAARPRRPSWFSLGLAGDWVATVVLGDDHVVFLDALATVLSQHGHEVCGVARNATELVTLVQMHQPDLCLIDHNAPADGDAEIIGWVMEASKSTSVLVLSASPTAPSVERVADVLAGVLYLLTDLAGRAAYTLSLALCLEVGIAGRPAHVLLDLAAAHLEPVAELVHEAHVVRLHFYGEATYCPRARDLIRCRPATGSACPGPACRGSWPPSARRRGRGPAAASRASGAWPPGG